MRRLAWRAASGGTAATSPPRSSMGERRKWRPVRRARAADEKNDFRNVNIGVLRLFVLSRAASGEESRGTAQPRRRTRRGAFSGRHGRQAACLARACAAAASGRRPSIRRVRACSSTGAMLPVSGSRQEARRARKTEREASGRIGAGGSGGRWVSQAGDSVLRVPYGPGCVWPVGSQGVDGSDRHAGAARGRNRGSGSKALGMISPVG